MLWYVLSVQVYAGLCVCSAVQYAHLCVSATLRGQEEYVTDKSVRPCIVSTNQCVCASVPSVFHNSPIRPQTVRGEMPLSF